MKRRHSSVFSLARGFTLLELLIAMALGLLLMSAVISVFVGSLRTYSTADALSRIQESARITMEVIRQDVRQAGFFGCRNNLQMEDPPGDGALAPGLIRNTLDSGSSEFDFGAAIEGYRWLGSVWSDVIDGSGGAFNPASVTALTPAPATHSDILAISRADDAGIVVASHNLPAATIFLDGASNLQQFDILLVSDCTTGAIFEATAANPGNSAGSVVHNTGTVKEGPGNRTANLGKTFDPSASVFRVIKHYYYVANSTTGRPGLFRNGVELAEDVERMRAAFAVDTNNDQQIDGYLSADAVTNWNDVVAVRFELLFSSGDEANVVDAPQTVTFFDGTTYTSPDNRLVQLFTMTVGLRNRLI